MPVLTQTTVTNYEREDTNSSEIFFNNYFKAVENISLNKNDAIFSYFQKITDNDESATALASAVLGTSASQGLDVMEVLDQFTRLNQNQLNAYLCMFLNLNRVNTSLLGLNNEPIKNRYIERCILP